MRYLYIYKWDIKIHILVSQRYSAASNSKTQMGVRCNSNYSQTEPSELNELLNKVVATHT